MFDLSILEICNIVHGYPINILNHNLILNDIAIRTDNLKFNSIFVTLQGNNTHGINYANEAINKYNASCLLTSYITQYPSIVVDDPIDAMHLLAKYHIDHKIGLTVVGITGSSGKTSITTLILKLSKLLSLNLRGTINSWNNSIGFPLTILSNINKSKLDTLILEYGGFNKEDFISLSNIAKPDISICTNILPVHLDTFGGTIDSIIYGKSRLITSMRKDGIVILNGDNNYCKSMDYGYNHLLIGRDKDSYRYSFKLHNIEGFNHKFTISDNVLKQTVQLEINIPGIHVIYNILQSISLLLIVYKDLNLLTISSYLKEINFMSLVERRLSILKERRNNNVIIDDSYNSNPTSMRISFEFTHTYNSSYLNNSYKVWYILGEMGSIDESNINLYLSSDLRDIQADGIIVFGLNAFILFKLIQNQNKYFITDRSFLIFLIEEILKKKNILMLFKGSGFLNFTSLIKQFL